MALEWALSTLIAMFLIFCIALLFLGTVWATKTALELLSGGADQ